MIAKLRTLIVDDDLSVARIHRMFVDSHHGFTVVGEAHSGASALALVEKLDPDVILLDIYLPDFSGLEVLSRLSVERARRVEVIAVTAARDLGSVREARANGVRHYLVKPFTASALRERLDEVLHQHDPEPGHLRAAGGGGGSFRQRGGRTGRHVACGGASLPGVSRRVRAVVGGTALRGDRPSGEPVPLGALIRLQRSSSSRSHASAAATTASRISSRVPASSSFRVCTVPPRARPRNTVPTG